MKKAAPIFFSLLLMAAGLAAKMQSHVSAELVSDQQTVTPGQTLRLTVHLHMQPGWHTYSDPSGDGGAPTSIQWDLPRGFIAGPIQWPKPERLKTPPLVTFVYTNDVLLPTEIQVPARIEAAAVHVKALVRWYECADVCVPGKADLDLVLPVSRSAAAPAHHSKFAAALVLAFLGGLILNLMPCVFPVLSFKILGLVNRAHGRNAVAYGLVYAAGVVASFLVLAGALIALKAGGAKLGWGFQLQSPAFVAALAALFVFLGLNMLGVFEIGVRLTRLADFDPRHSHLLGAFLSGALATVVATPCTAPFMGTALGYALLQSTPVALLIFGTLGLGMAAPYVLLCWDPVLLSLLPKPGAWMDKLKKLLSLLLFGTAFWLAWVFHQQTSAPAQSKAWEPFSAERLAVLRNEGRPVFVDFTADWCLTCKVNESLALDKPAVMRLFKEKNVALLRADWTAQDARITRALEDLGRESVPVYALYAPGEAQPKILPAILTSTIIEKALRELK